MVTLYKVQEKHGHVYLASGHSLYNLALAEDRGSDGLFSEHQVHLGGRKVEQCIRNISKISAVSAS